MIDLATRAVHIADITTNPNSEFMAQVARNLTDQFDGFLRQKRHLIIDRDSKFTAQFKRILKDAGVKTVLTAWRAPNMNAVSERFVLSIKSECLDRMILFGERSLRRAVSNYADHYHSERAHQGLGNVMIDCHVQAGNGEVVVRERLGGLLKYYHRSAA